MKEMEKASEQFEVFEENWDAVRIFVKATTQWRFSDGAYLGLDYTSLDFLFRLYAIRKRASVFEQVQSMEQHALSLLNKKGS